MSAGAIRATFFVALAIEVAMQVYSWGGPIRGGYRIVAVPVKPTGATAQQTVVERDRTSRRWTAWDTDGDGTWDEFTTLRDNFTRPGLRTPPKRWLVVCLDGVPLGEMQSLWDRGHFREFFRPTATVSTLPSDTETAMTEVLHAKPVPGYEHVYFGRGENRIRGGFWITLTGFGIPYVHVLDYDTPGWAKIVHFVVTRKAYRADVGRFRDNFLASSAPVFLAHIAASDGLLHVDKLETAEPLLSEFENALSEIYFQAHGDLGLIVFSDHGNTETPSRAAHVETFLAQRGWQIRESVRGPRDVAIPSYGLVAFAAIYCRPEAIETIAENLRGIEGADVIVSRLANGSVDGGANLEARIRAAASPATADLAWSPDGRKYRYTAHDGDPLGLVPVFDSLRAAGKLDANDFASDADLFAATSLAAFPDSAARIRAWTMNQVRNPADILLSFKPGYYHGIESFRHIVNLAGTHGGLERSGSLGFVMATYPLPPATRLGDLIPANLLPRLQNAEIARHVDFPQATPSEQPSPLY
jgi:hypothetical protein